MERKWGAPHREQGFREHHQFWEWGITERVGRSGHEAGAAGQSNHLWFLLFSSRVNFHWESKGLLGSIWLICCSPGLNAVPCMLDSAAASHSPPKCLHLEGWLLWTLLPKYLSTLPFSIMAPWFLVVTKHLAQFELKYLSSDLLPTKPLVPLVRAGIGLFHSLVYFFNVNNFM